MTPLFSLTAITHAAVLREATARLRRGEVGVIPTDTVYGLAAHPEHPASVARLGLIKGRPTGKPIAYLAADLAAVRSVVPTLPPPAQRLAANFWPGALTLVLDCAGGSEGFRVPAHPFCCRLLAACGGLLRVTSANFSGDAPALDALKALADVGQEADFIVDGGTAAGGIASSVVRVTNTGVATLLRVGALSAATLGLADV